MYINDAPNFSSSNALIVDDNASMRHLLTEVVRRLRFREIIQARDGLDGIEALKNNPVDLALVDLAMPMLDGIEFIRLVRTATDSPNPDLPVIVVSGHGTERKVKEAKAAGADAFIVKPVTPKALTQQIVAVMARAALRKKPAFEGALQAALAETEMDR